MSWDVESFKEKVESEHTFPGIYVFKFIVPTEKKEDILELLPQGKTSMRSSSNNHYVSITCRAQLSSSQDVVEVYFEANKVEGTIAL